MTQILERPDLRVESWQDMPTAWSETEVLASAGGSSRGRMNKALHLIYELDEAANDLDTSDARLAESVGEFITRTKGTTAMPISTSSFASVMNRLELYPDSRAEMLSRAFSKSFSDGWRPVGEREKELLGGWLADIGSYRLYTKVIMTEAQSGVQYIDNEQLRGKVKRLTYFAGRLLSQRQIRRNHLRGQGGKLAQQSTAVFPEVPNA